VPRVEIARLDEKYSRRKLKVAWALCCAHAGLNVFELTTAHYVRQRIKAPATMCEYPR